MKIETIIIHSLVKLPHRLRWLGGENAVFHINQLNSKNTVADTARKKYFSSSSFRRSSSYGLDAPKVFEIFHVSGSLILGTFETRDRFSRKEKTGLNESSSILESFRNVLISL